MKLEFIPTLAKIYRPHLILIGWFFINIALGFIRDGMGSGDYIVILTIVLNIIFGISFILKYSHNLTNNRGLLVSKAALFCSLLIFISLGYDLMQYLFIDCEPLSSFCRDIGIDSITLHRITQIITIFLIPCIITSIKNDGEKGAYKPIGYISLVILFLHSIKVNLGGIVRDSTGSLTWSNITSNMMFKIWIIINIIYIVIIATTLLSKSKK